MSFVVVSWNGSAAVTHRYDSLDEALTFAWARMSAGASPVSVEDVDTARSWKEDQIRAAWEQRRDPRDDQEIQTPPSQP